MGIWKVGFVSMNLSAEESEFYTCKEYKVLNTETPNRRYVFYFCKQAEKQLYILAVLKGNNSLTFIL